MRSINPKAEILETDLMDTLTNLISSLGTGKDKRAHSRITNTAHLSRNGNQRQLSDMYRTDWLSGKVVDIVPDDMTREWRSFSSDDLTPDMVEEMEEEEKRVQLQHYFNFAHKLSRLYGTSFIVIDVDDGGTPEDPLDISKIKEGGLKHIKAIDRHRVQVVDATPIGNPLDVNFGMPSFYQFNETPVRIHYSRLLRFDAVRLPYQEFRENNWMSDSVLDRLYDSIINFNSVTQGASSMVYDTNVDVISIQGFMDLIQSPEGMATLTKRFGLAATMKSFNNMMILDKEEEYEIKNRSFAGLPELIDRYGHILAAASYIPATRLLGSSPQGLNSTGEGDMRNYYDTLGSEQVSVYSTKLDYFDKIMAASLGMSLDLNLEYKFNPLYKETKKEKADTQYVNAQRDQIYINNGVVPEHTVTKELKQEGVYTNIDDQFIRESENAFEIGSQESFTPDETASKEEEEDEGGEGAKGTGNEI